MKEEHKLMFGFLFSLKQLVELVESDRTRFMTFAVSRSFVIV